MMYYNLFIEKDFDTIFTAAENYIVSLDKVSKCVDNMIKIVQNKNLKEYLLNEKSKLNEILPYFREIRNSISHPEDRVLNLGPDNKKAINDDTNRIMRNIENNSYQTEIYLKKDQRGYEKFRIKVEINKAIIDSTNSVINGIEQKFLETWKRSLFYFEG